MWGDCPKQTESTQLSLRSSASPCDDSWLIDGVFTPCSLVRLSQSDFDETSILFYSVLCPSTAGRGPPPESSNCLCPLLSLSIPLLVAPQCHLSNDVLVFRLILHPATVLLIVHLFSFIRAMCKAHFLFVWILLMIHVPS